MPSRLRYTLLICLSTGFAAQALAADTNSGLPPAVSDPHFQLAPGYLKQADLPDSLVLLGPPPQTGSPALARDEQARQATLPLRGTARWELARQDADLSFPQPAKNFSCAMGLQIDAKTTPHIYTLMQRTLTDAGLSTYGVKDKYQRVRPFVVHDEGTCRPDQEALLRNDGSYPSGHTAAGWAWALILAEIHPERANTLLSRGMSFGQSRVICDAHWQSDVDAGRIMGAATVARLHADPVFRKDLELARKEVVAAMAKGAPMECSSETAALSEKP
ncbi:acid phosphatase [Bordetella genomosp. 12]|uniref:Acid phosphatase n=1 Tax=Bordetella genomosp. 12 TaxID=463035 RepID=A0A261VLT6_9BORD|nr:phosphatase PAP2 family protein [Bordetella genomosp. 12]OZI75098.1 acid phosphatase [Bordetella genomosp. 12]